MPKKKAVSLDEQPVEALAEPGMEENGSQASEVGAFPDAAHSGDGDWDYVLDEIPLGEHPSGNPRPDDPPTDGPPDAFPAEEGSPFSEVDEAAGQSPDSMEMECDDPEYGSLLQELGEKKETEGPLTLDDPPPDDEASEDGPTSASLDGDEPSQPGRPRDRHNRGETPDAPTAVPRRDRVLTIDARDAVQTEDERKAVIWHEIQNAHWTRRILTGTLDGVERSENGRIVAVVVYKGFRVVIPVKEMMLFTGKVPSGAEFQELMLRMRRILNARLGSEIDFVVKGHENKSRSVVASRKDAMYRKRQAFYLDRNEQGEPLIYEGRVVQARVVAVAEKVIRVEVFGVECAILARGLSRAWVGDAAEHYDVGDRILVRVQKISGTTVEDLSITADVRSISTSNASDDLKKCVRQGRYAGRVTDVRGGVLYVRLNNGVNAIAHSCYDRRTPGKGDDVSFSVTRLDEEQGVAVGLITRIIKQNL